MSLFFRLVFGCLAYTGGSIASTWRRFGFKGRVSSDRITHSRVSTMNDGRTPMLLSFALQSLLCREVPRYGASPFQQMAHTCHGDSRTICRCFDRIDSSDANARDRRDVMRRRCGAARWVVQSTSPLTPIGHRLGTKVPCIRRVVYWNVADCRWNAWYAVRCECGATVIWAI